MLPEIKLVTLASFLAWNLKSGNETQNIKKFKS